MASYAKRTTARGTVYDVRFLADVNGVRKLVHLSGFSSRREAERAYIEWKPASLPAVSETFEDVFSSYVEFKSGTLSQNSLYNLKLTFSRRILPVFAGRAVSDVSRSDVVRWQSDLWQETDEGGKLLKNGTCKQTRALFSAFMTWAGDVFGFVSPFVGVKAPRRREEAREMHIWDVPEFETFIKAVPSAEFRALFSVLFYSGCRIGEGLALTLEDFSRVGDVYSIRINKSAQAEREGFDIVSPTKNSSSVRSVSLPSRLSPMLSEFLGTCEGPFVFGGSRPWDRARVSDVFNSAISASGVSRIRIHDLRHSHASILLASGVPVTEVSRRLGHSSVNTTLSTYAHCLKVSEDAILGALDARIDGASRLQNVPSDCPAFY